MADIALFHSVLGVRPGVHDAVDRLRSEGHEVVVVDQYDGRVFDDYAEASEFAESIGYPALMRSAAEAVKGVADGFLAAGFSNRGGMAEYVPTQRRVRGVLMLSGALDLAMLGFDAWPAGVPAQIHYTLDDPFRNQAWIDAVADQVRLRAPPWRSSTTQAPDICSPTVLSPRSTTSVPPNCCGRVYFPSAPHHRRSDTIAEFGVSGRSGTHGVWNDVSCDRSGSNLIARVGAALLRVRGFVRAPIWLYRARLGFVFGTQNS